MPTHQISRGDEDSEMGWGLPGVPSRAPRSREGWQNSGLEMHAQIRGSTGPDDTSLMSVRRDVSIRKRSSSNTRADDKRVASGINHARNSKTQCYQQLNN